jgi:energy-coupling factor transport system ATP-binding protein
MKNNTEQANAEILVEVRAVTYTHWNQTSPSLHDVSLEIRRGTLNVLVGPSGSGKSTLCDVFNGVIPHLHGGKLEGEVFVDGVSTHHTQVNELAQKVGRVFQDPEIMFATLYVEDEIAFGPENLRFSIPRIRAIVDRLLSQTDLAAFRSNLVWNLSGGQIQKLGLATVLAMEPGMIVLDEPTSNLDPGATQDVHQLILELCRNGVTVLLVTRELDEFLAQADQLIVLEGGHILAAGRPDEVLRHHGAYMIATLGVWLPETSEVGIGLQGRRLLPAGGVPITVAETTRLLESNGVFLASSALSEAAAPTSDLPRGECLIKAENVRYRYPGGAEALKGVSLDINAQEWLMIVGRNGAGKSTLARMLVGLLQPSEGRLQMFGRPSDQWKVQELANEIALVFQNPEHQFLTDSVADEIEYSLLAQGVTDPEEVEQKTDDMLSMLGLAHVAAVHPFALSAGLKRRLGVATMLVGEPKILLVDEPTYGQDKAMTHTLMALMQEIRARGVGIVMITHDMRLVQEYAERVMVMSDGQVLFDGPSAGLFDRTEVLVQANLRRTILHHLIADLRRSGYEIRRDIRTTEDLVQVLTKNHKD